MVFISEKKSELTSNSPVLIVDGTCVFCNGFANFISKQDKKGYLYFSTIQSDYAIEILQKIGTEYNDSIILVYKNSIYIYASALIQLSYLLGGTWRLIGQVAKLIPRPIRDRCYKVVAKNRFLFGKQECILPSTFLKSRILK